MPGKLFYTELRVNNALTNNTVFSTPIYLVKYDFYRPQTRVCHSVHWEGAGGLPLNGESASKVGGRGSASKGRGSASRGVCLWWSASGWGDGRNAFLFDGRIVLFLSFDSSFYFITSSEIMLLKPSSYIYYQFDI